eukprot:5026006-Pyramimonas_sp.AAC.1
MFLLEYRYRCLRWPTATGMGFRVLWHLGGTLDHCQDSCVVIQCVISIASTQALHSHKRVSVKGVTTNERATFVSDCPSVFAIAIN